MNGYIQYPRDPEQRERLAKCLFRIKAEPTNGPMFRLIEEAQVENMNDNLLERDDITRERRSGAVLLMRELLEMFNKSREFI